MKRLKKVWALILCLCMAVMMFPTTAFAADTVPTPPEHTYEVYVNNTQVNSDNANDVLGDGTVSYDSESNTLSLKGNSDLLQIKNETGNSFIISVSGENKVAHTESSQPVDLIISNAPVTITGGRADTLTLSGYNQNSYIDCVEANGDVIVEGLTLVLTNSNNHGISSTGNITVQNGATVKGDTGYMFYATTSGAGKLTVKDSTVTAPLTGTTVSGWMSIWVNDMEVSNSTVKITAANGIYIANDVHIHSNSTVSVTASGTVTPYPGIWAINDMTIENSTVTGESYTYAGLYATGNLSISGGHVKGITTASGYPALAATESLTITGPVTVEGQTNGGLLYNGNVGSVAVLTSDAASTAMYELRTGSDEASAVEVEGSPFNANTDVLEHIQNCLYLNIAEHEHASLVKTEAVAATHMTDGNIEYWRCGDCGKYFSDEGGTQEITPAEIVIPKLTAHTSDGMGWKSDESSHWQTCACGEKLNEAAHTFQWVTDKEATATEAGSRHEACAVCGYEKAPVEIPATGTAAPPQTGDTSRTTLLLALLLASGAVLTAAALVSLRRKYSR